MACVGYTETDHTTVCWLETSFTSWENLRKYRALVRIEPEPFCSLGRDGHSVGLFSPSTVTWRRGTLLVCSLLQPLLEGGELCWFVLSFNRYLMEGSSVGLFSPSTVTWRRELCWFVLSLTFTWRRGTLLVCSLLQLLLEGGELCWFVLSFNRYLHWGKGGNVIKKKMPAFLSQILSLIVW